MIVDVSRSYSICFNTMTRLAIAFQKKKINISVPKPGTLTATVSVAEFHEGEEIALRLGGFDPVTERHPDWGKFALEPGDIVTIRVHDDNRSDEPLFELDSNSESILEMQKAEVRRLASKFGWSITE